ncbi:hypothetical protein WG66_006089, partial [Moniliophthora roreri]
MRSEYSHSCSRNNTIRLIYISFIPIPNDGYAKTSVPDGGSPRIRRDHRLRRDLRVDNAHLASYNIC